MVQIADVQMCKFLRQVALTNLHICTICKSATLIPIFNCISPGWISWSLKVDYFIAKNFSSNQKLT